MSQKTKTKTNFLTPALVCLILAIDRRHGIPQIKHLIGRYGNN